MKTEQSLDKQERNWILERRVKRLTDNKEVQIYPMGAERYLASVLDGKQARAYPIVDDIVGKDVLVIPGYGNSGFLFAAAGAKSVTVYDKDPVTIAWVKAFKLFYHYREVIDGKPYPTVGDLLTALTAWYPPLIKLPKGWFANTLQWAMQPNNLRRTYLHYLLDLVQRGVKAKQQGFELDKPVYFFTGTLDRLNNRTFDTAFVPYLLGVRNGIEQEQEIVAFLQQLQGRVPNGQILITPTRNTKQYYCLGKRYFTTTPYKTLQAIPGLDSFTCKDDKFWFKTQGLVKLT